MYEDKELYIKEIKSERFNRHEGIKKDVWYNICYRGKDLRFLPLFIMLVLVTFGIALIALIEYHPWKEKEIVICSCDTKEIAEQGIKYYKNPS